MCINCIIYSGIKCIVVQSACGGLERTFHLENWLKVSNDIVYIMYISGLLYMYLTYTCMLASNQS